MPQRSQKIKTDELENMLLCAHWLIEQFEAMRLSSIAKLFQGALSDSIVWLNTMAEQGEQFKKYNEDIEIKEAKVIRDILVKYASIQNPKKRKKALQTMRRAINTNDD